MEINSEILTSPTIVVFSVSLSLNDAPESLSSSRFETVASGGLEPPELPSGGSPVGSVGIVRESLTQTTQSVQGATDFDVLAMSQPVRR